MKLRRAARPVGRPGRLLAPLLSIGLLGGCRAPYTPRPASDGAPVANPCGENKSGAGCRDGDPALGEITTPEGVPLRMACTPSGPELCFDATDNNCNGVIDEGCGVQTGPLQFAIAWEEVGHINLEVTDARGEQAKLDEPTQIGLTKDRDCGRSTTGCHGQNMENVFLAGETEPPAGKYRVEIKVDRPEGVHFPMKVRFGGRIGMRTFSTDLELSSPEDAKVFTFVIE